MSVAIVLSMEKSGQKGQPSLVKGPAKAISIKAKSKVTEGGGEIESRRERRPS